MIPDPSTAAFPAKRLARFAPLIAVTVLAAGCATVSNPNPDDPWESYNRSMYSFNDTVDRAFLKPVAQGYQAITPEPVRTCIHNMFNNVGDVWSALNSFLQGRIPDGINTMGRVLFNTTMGLGGCIDVASMNGSRRISNDFGVTLGVWGFDSGPYLVLPFLGASSLRDGVATAGYFASGASNYTSVMAVDNVPLRNSLVVLGVIDLRASLLDTEKIVNQVALDRYSFIRDAYLQRRKALVRGHNGDVPLPDYSDNDLPDYSVDDPSESPAAAPAVKTGQ